MPQQCKKPILILGYEDEYTARMSKDWLDKMSQSYELIFAGYPMLGFHEVAKAKWEKKNPIAAIIIKRNTLIKHRDSCKDMVILAEYYSEKSYFLTICMVENDQDGESKDKTIGAFFAKEDDWNQVQVILEDNVK